MATRSCPYCKQIGFVRFETVVTKGQSHRSFYCSACDRTWQVSDDGAVAGEAPESAEPPPDRSRADTGKPPRNDR